MTEFKENLSTIVTENDIKDAIWDSCGVLYSRDGKRLLKCENKNLRQYDIKVGKEFLYKRRDLVLKGNGHLN